MVSFSPQPCIIPGVNFKMAECQTLNLVKKPNTESSIWTYFGLEADESDKPLRDKEDSPVYRACKKSVLAKGGEHFKPFNSLLAIPFLPCTVLT